MKRTFAMLLPLAMLVTLFAACGNGNDSTGSGSTEPTAASQSAAEPTEAAPAEPETASASEAEEPHIPASEDDVVDATDPDNPYNLSEDNLEMIHKIHEMDAAQIEAGLMPGPEKNYDADGNELSIRGVPYNYPIEEEGVELEMWAVLNGNLTNWIDGYGSLRAWNHVQDATGISLGFVSVSEDTMTDQFNLMIASGDYSDIIFVPAMGMSVVTTPTDLLAQDVIIQLDDYMEEYMPNYSAWLDFDEVYRRETADDEGRHLATYLLNMSDIVEMGNWMRKDLLDEFEAFFEACKSDGLEQVIGANADSLLTVHSGAYNIPGLSGMALYHEGGTVKSAYQADTAYDYLSKLVEWYQKGYIDEDVMSITAAPHDQIFTSSIYSGNLALFEGGSVHYADFIDNAEVEGFDLVGVGDIVMNAGDKSHFMEPMKVKTGNAITVTADCEHPEAACQLLDWFYTDDGINTGNYGEEGLTWYWDSDGNRQYTELIWNDTEFGIVPANAIGIYALQSRFSFVQDPYASIVYQTHTALDAIDAWIASRDSDYYLNTNSLTLTEDEQRIVGECAADITTYAAEHLSKVVVGATELNESWWKDFVAQLESLGLNDLIAQYQSAYDRYLTR